MRHDEHLDAILHATPIRKRHVPRLIPRWLRWASFAAISIGIIAARVWMWHRLGCADLPWTAWKFVAMCWR